MRIATRNDVLSFLGATSFDEEQLRLLGIMRERAVVYQDDLDFLDIFWDLSIPDALDHLIEGRADAAGEWAGCAYNTALQLIIAWNSSDPVEVGCFRNPIVYFSELDDELGRCGVPQELRPFRYLFAGPPIEIPFRIPGSLEGYPEVGHLSLSRAKDVADAYRAVIDQIDKGFVDDLEVLTKGLEFGHDEWVRSQEEELDWYNPDTIFFWIN
ncbi:hypothetical protein ACFYTS_07415 [Nocardia sp. NPDC004151]|uniref:DUF7691 family protein n=1 Tax=Nocardia sp. NPDC004151 TaxID=3364304 RepID=UPI0036C87F33